MVSKYKKDRTGQTFAREPEYRGALDELRFSEEAKERMAQRLVKAGETQKKPRPVLRRAAIAALALVLVAALTIGAGALGVIPGIDNVFSPMFQSEDLEPEELAVIQELGAPVGLSITDNDVTITLESVIRDRYECRAVLSIKKRGIEGNELGFNWFLLKDGQGTELSCGYGCTDIVPGDDTLQIVATWNGEQEMPAGNVTLKIVDVVLNSHRLFREKTIKGTWELDFDLGSGDMTVDLPAGQVIEREEGTLTLDEIAVSPLSIMIKYTEEQSGQRAEGAAGADPFLDIVITRKDGVRFFYPGSEEEGGFLSGLANKGELAESGKTTGFCNFSFDRHLLPFEEIESITIEGVDIPLEN